MQFCFLFTCRSPPTKRPRLSAVENESDSSKALEHVKVLYIHKKNFNFHFMGF